MYYKVYHDISGSLTVNITTVTNITLTGALAGYTYIITVVPVNILGDGYPNKTIGYLNIIKNCVMFTSHIVIIPKEPIITSVVTTSFNESNQCVLMYYLSINVLTTFPIIVVITTSASLNISKCINIYYCI